MRYYLVTFYGVADPSGQQTRTSLVRVDDGEFPLGEAAAGTGATIAWRKDDTPTWLLFDRTGDQVGTLHVREVPTSQVRILLAPSSTPETRSWTA